MSALRMALVAKRQLIDMCQASLAESRTLELRWIHQIILHFTRFLSAIIIQLTTYTIKVDAS